MRNLKTAKAVREALGAVNPYGLLVKGDLLVYYVANDTGRGGRGAHWVATRIGYRNDPEGGYWQHGHKWFDCHSGNRQEKFVEACAWMSDRYKVENDWVKDPFGHYEPRAQLVARLADRDIAWAALTTKEK